MRRAGTDTWVKTAILLAALPAIAQAQQLCFTPTNGSVAP